MSFITVEGVEALLNSSSALYNNVSDNTISTSGNGWDPNWSNPGGLTGDNYNWSGNSDNSSEGFFDTVKSVISGIFTGLGSMVGSIVNLFNDIGQTFSGAPGTFFDTGVNTTTGLRSDGQPLGYGCGDAKTDGIVPDHFGTANLIPICSIHDNDYATLGMSKEAADAKLGANISAAIEGAGYNHWIAEAVGAIYKAGAQIAGAEAYAKAQAEAQAQAAAGNH